MRPAVDFCSTEKAASRSNDFARTGDDLEFGLLAFWSIIFRFNDTVCSLIIRFNFFTDVDIGGGRGICEIVDEFRIVDKVLRI